jgi:ribosomal protein S18 acetylase RimI-like enzyme
VTDLARLPIAGMITIRPARQTDLIQLEWFGEYARFRRLYQQTFDAMQRDGSRYILVAEFNDCAVGQLFMHFQRSRNSRLYLYSFRVMPMFRGFGIGTLLIQSAEQMGQSQAMARAAIAVDRSNASARRLYERLGYQIVGEDNGLWNYLDHQNRLRWVKESSWVLEKSLDVR